MGKTSKKGPLTAEQCGAEYAKRTGRCVFDDVRLGWALALREHLRQQALRAFANLSRARAVAFEPEEPGWVSEGLVSLRPAFEAYGQLDPGWRVLLAWPAFVKELGTLEPEGARALLEGLGVMPEVRLALERAQGELDVSHGARAEDTALRELFVGVSMKRPAVTASEVSLLAIAIGLDQTGKLDPARRRWVERMRRWAAAPERRHELAGIAAADVLLDVEPRPWAPSELLTG